MNNEITSNTALVHEHPHRKGIEEEQLYRTVLLFSLWAKKYHCWKSRIYCPFSIESVEKKLAKVKSVMACNRYGQCRRHGTDSLPSSQSGPTLGSLLNAWKVHGKQWYRATGLWGWSWILLPASLSSLMVMAPLQFVPVKKLACRQQPVFPQL